MRVIGLMSGTSMDGIDVAVCDIDLPRVQLLGFGTKAYAAEVRDALAAALPPNCGSVRDVCVLNVILGEAFAQAALEVAHDSGSDMNRVDLIGSHGQTLYHFVEPDGVAPYARSTLQVGDAAIIAQRTGVTCVADFRAADVAAGGQGAPLSAFTDWLLLRDALERRVALNIGGIANVTILPAGGTAEDARAFDTGPGNMLIDACVRFATDGRQRYDAGGAMAAAGRPFTKLLERLLLHPYFARVPPKTTGAQEFGADFAQAIWDEGRQAGCSAEDIIATVTALSAQTISAAIPDDCERLIVSGGGAHNKALMRMLAEPLASSKANPPPIEESSAYGLPVDAKEAMAFAMLAVETIRAHANTLPACTGARYATVAGKIAPGKNFASLMQRVWR